MRLRIHRVCVVPSIENFMDCRRAVQTSSHRPFLAALPIFWAASSLPGSDEFRLEARLSTRHVWSSLHPVSIRPALFEGLLPWLAY
jgi:hypothetical protein